MKSVPGRILEIIRDTISASQGKCLIHAMLNKAQQEEFIDSIESSGYITLNIGYNAVRNYVAGEEGISFDFRIGGRPRSIYLDYRQICCVLDGNDFYGTSVPIMLHVTVDLVREHTTYLRQLEEEMITPPKEPEPPKRGKPTLKVIK